MRRTLALAPPRRYPWRTISGDGVRLNRAGIACADDSCLARSLRAWRVFLGHGGHDRMVEPRVRAVAPRATADPYRATRSRRFCFPPPGAFASAGIVTPAGAGTWANSSFRTSGLLIF